MWQRESEGEREQTRVCLWWVQMGEGEGRRRWRRRGESLNERFVLENGDHIPLCENGSCSGLRGERERERRRRASEGRNAAVHRDRLYVCACVCVCVSVRVGQDFRSRSTVPCMQMMQPRKNKHAEVKAQRGWGGCGVGGLGVGGSDALKKEFETKHKQTNNNRKRIYINQLSSGQLLNHNPKASQSASHNQREKNQPGSSEQVRCDGGQEKLPLWEET